MRLRISDKRRLAISESCFNHLIPTTRGTACFIPPWATTWKDDSTRICIFICIFNPPSSLLEGGMRRIPEARR